MWKKINSFNVIIPFSVTLEKLNRNPQACPPPPPTPHQKFPSRIHTVHLLDVSRIKEAREGALFVKNEC